MQRAVHGPVQTLLNGTLILGLTVALSVAWYISYRGAVNLRSAFAYHAAVAAAQRDAGGLLAQGVPAPAAAQNAAAQAALQDDLQHIDALAEDQAQRAPAFPLPAGAAEIAGLLHALDDRAHLAALRFDRVSKRDLATDDLALGLFAIVAALLVLVRARLHTRVAEGKALVDRLQRAFLSRHRVLPNVDVGTILLSATRGSNIGGDMYDVFCGTDGYGYVLIADVSGKGIDAAVDTAFVKYTIRALFKQTSDPGSIVSSFSAMYAQTITNPESFVVLFLAVVNVDTCEITYASAGHEPAFIRSGGQVHQLPVTGPIVGIDPTAVYETQPVPLPDGEPLVLATDGLTETRDRKGVLLGAEGVSRWLSQIDGSAQEVADQLIRRLRRRSRNRIRDDLALVVIRVVRALPAHGSEPAGGTPKRELAGSL